MPQQHKTCNKALQSTGAADLVREIDLQGLGTRIREIRKDLPLTQEALGEITGLTQSQIARIERGQKEPPLLFLAQIAVLGNCKIVFDITGDIKVVKPGKMALLSQLEESSVSIGEFLRQIIQSEGYDVNTPEGFKRGVRTFLGFCSMLEDEERELVRRLIYGEADYLPEELIGSVAYAVRGFRPSSNVMPNELRRMQNPPTQAEQEEDENRQNFNGTGLM